MFTKEWKYLLLIIVTFIAACIETDIYLPTFTDMMAYFSISADKIQSLLTWNFIGICLSGPLYGPISDAIGRKKPLLAALGLFFAGSLITIFAENFELMLWGRVLQGLGSGGCFTLGTAIIFDVFQEQQAVLAINRLNSIVPLIMAVAPMLGGYLNYAYGFRSNFLAIALCVLLSLITCLFFFDESLANEKRVPFVLKKVLKSFKTVSLSIPFWQTTAVVSLGFAGYLAFLACISVLFVIEFGVSKELLPFFQAALLGTWVIASLNYRKAIDSFGLPKVKIIGTIFFLLGGLSFIGAVLIFPENPYWLTAPMLLYTFGINWVQGLYFPEGMALFPDIKGITASFLTSARLLITAIVVGLAGKLYDGTIYPIMMVMSGVVIVVFATIICYERSKKGLPQATEESHVIEII
jgi:DHA1 family bicyclomycin/chloramphenicol resistance-like MFS transporter